MILVKDLLKEKSFPKWFSNHRIFKEIDQVNKVFPGIGLPNAEGDVDVDNKDTARKTAKRLITAVKNEADRRIKTLQTNEKLHKVSPARRAKLDKCVALLDDFSKLAKDKDKFIIENNGRISLGLPEDIRYKEEERPIYRQGESLFRVYNKLNEALRDGMFITMPKIEDLEAFKSFSTQNVPNHKYKIVFSSDGIEGAWDISTMSMRGVESCQSWNGAYSHCVIGSVIDPFVGIIYLTSGANYNKYGTRMMRRCVVRFVINEENKKPFILLDNMYPAYDTKVFTAFKNFIKLRTQNKFEVYYAPNYRDLGKAYLPLTDIRKKLADYGRNGERGGCGDLNSIASYQDIHIKSKTSNSKDENAVRFEKNSKKKSKKFVVAFTNALNATIKDVSVEELPDKFKPIIRKLKGEKNYNHALIVSDIAEKIAIEIINSVDKNNFTNSDTYLRRIYYNYFNFRNDICNDIKTEMVRKINKQLALKLFKRLQGNKFVDMMEILFPKVDITMKENLKKLVEKRKFSGALPLP